MQLQVAAAVLNNFQTTNNQFKQQQNSEVHGGSQRLLGILRETFASSAFKVFSLSESHTYPLHVSTGSAFCIHPSISTMEPACDASW